MKFCLLDSISSRKSMKQNVLLDHLLGSIVRHFISGNIAPQKISLSPEQNFTCVLQLAKSYVKPLVWLPQAMLNRYVNISLLMHVHQLLYYYIMP